ncbi:galactose-3-O-sulfotransferase 2 isoform X1 [Anguilla anguilla]|uniref:galactose-3-O-sulfotransferase 2 isoform X1 n=3 Tax=Anguilla anguilla TaxID=7936 RepID=UPI0015B36671|nr:galactose-3-O-sulfotransferase 2 isoform X1 [Anguilla anguilla]
MPPLQRKAIRERALYFWKSTPWSTRLKGALCSHLRHMWMVLMALTVLCVAIQILGVVRQSRNDKILKQFANEKLFSMRFTIEFQKALSTTQPPLEQQQSDLVPQTEYMHPINQEVTVKRENLHQEAVKIGNIPHAGQHHRGKALSEQLPLHISPRGHINKFTKITRLQKGKGGRLVAAATVKKTRPLTVLEEDDFKSIQLAPSVISEVLRPHRKWFPSRGSANSPRLTRLKPQRSATALASLQNGPDPSKELMKQRLPSAPRTTPRSPSAVNARIATAKPAAAGRGASTCQPKTHIVFLKTHKTASSTILNILYRYGDSRNLTFALPLNKHSQLFYPLYFAAHFVEGFRLRAMKEFNIMCNHMRFMPAEVKRVMPEDTFYFSILRNPVSMMESIFMYYKSIPAFHRARNLDDFLNNAWHSYNASLSNNHYARNLLAFDFGFNNNNNYVDIERQANLSISMIEQNFHLVLMSEYFDESMILLKNALCWSLDDVVSFKLNSRSNRTRQWLSPLTMNKIKIWNSLDWKIYQHFNITFWKRVEQTVGRENMKREVAQLQERRRQLMKTCLKEGGAVDPSQVKDSALKPFQYGAAVIQGYNLNPGLDGATKKQCQDLITPELQYTAALYTKQFPELAAKLASSQKQSFPFKVMTREVRRSMERHSRNLLSSPRNQSTLFNTSTVSRLPNVP